MTRPLDPEEIRHEITNLLAAFPELAEDEILRADMIEAETLAFEVLSEIVRKIGDATALSEGTAAYVKELQERKARIERRIEGLRTLIFKIMQTADLKKAELPEATLSVRNGTPKVLVIDETQIPDFCFRMKKELNKQAVKAVLESGENVPGAALSNGEPSLSIRVK